MSSKLHSKNSAPQFSQENVEAFQQAFSSPHNHVSLFGFVPNKNVWDYIESVVNNDSSHQSFLDNTSSTNSDGNSTLSSIEHTTETGGVEPQKTEGVEQVFNNMLFDFASWGQLGQTQNNSNTLDIVETNGSVEETNATTNQLTESSSDTNHVVNNTTQTSNSVEDTFGSMLSTVASHMGKDIEISSNTNGSSTTDSSVQSSDENIESDTALNESTPLMELLNSLGKTARFLEAVYADSELINAMSVEFSADKQIGILGSPRVTDKVALRYATYFDVDAVISDLSVGSNMPSSTRKGLYRIIKSLTVEQAMAAFEKRFNHPLVNYTSRWTGTTIRVLWRQLDVLPDQDVSDLTVLSTFVAISGGGGFGPSWEKPGAQSIKIGMNNSLGTISHVIRHEVGHAVHTEIPSVVNAWLENDIGFWFFNGRTEGIGQWVEELGGFPSTYQNESGENVPFGDEEQQRVLGIIKSFIGGGGSFSPSRESVEDGQSESDQMLWSSMTENVRAACIESTSNWYSNYEHFASGQRGRYFLNYWYQRPCWMSEEAVSVVKSTGKSYTAMSEKEFFANVYAEYFKDPNGYMDHSKWGGNLPDNVKQFFSDHIVDRQPYKPPKGEAQSSQGKPPPSGGMAGTP